MNGWMNSWCEDQGRLKLERDPFLLLCLLLTIFPLFLPHAPFITFLKLPYKKKKSSKLSPKNVERPSFGYTMYHLSSQEMEEFPRAIYPYMHDREQSLQKINPYIWLFCKGFTKCKTNHSWRLSFETFPLVFRERSHPVTCILRPEVLQMVSCVFANMVFPINSSVLSTCFFWVCSGW